MGRAERKARRTAKISGKAKAASKPVNLTAKKTFAPLIWINYEMARLFSLNAELSRLEPFRKPIHEKYAQLDFSLSDTEQHVPRQGDDSVSVDLDGFLRWVREIEPNPEKDDPQYDKKIESLEHFKLFTGTVMRRLGVAIAVPDVQNEEEEPLEGVEKGSDS